VALYIDQITGCESNYHDFPRRVPRRAFLQSSVAGIDAARHPTKTRCPGAVATDHARLVAARADPFIAAALIARLSCGHLKLVLPDTRKKARGRWIISRFDQFRAGLCGRPSWSCHLRHPKAAKSSSLAAAPALEEHDVTHMIGLYSPPAAPHDPDRRENLGQATAHTAAHPPEVWRASRAARMSAT